MNRIVTCCLATIAMTGFASPAFPKGETVKLEISQSVLGKPLEVRDKSAIEANPWSGNFVDWDRGEAHEPSADLAPYTIKFYIQPPRGGAIQMKYAAYYVWDRSIGRAFVYLPSPKDDLYRSNSAIVREGKEGKWYFASKQWGMAIRGALPPPEKAEQTVPADERNARG